MLIINESLRLKCNFGLYVIIRKLMWTLYQIKMLQH